MYLFIYYISVLTLQSKHTRPRHTLFLLYFFFFYRNNHSISIFFHLFSPFISSFLFPSQIFLSFFFNLKPGILLTLYSSTFFLIFIYLFFLSHIFSSIFILNVLIPCSYFFYLSCFFLLLFIFILLHFSTYALIIFVNVAKHKTNYAFFFMFVGTKTFSISRFLFFFPFVFVNDSTLFMPYDNRFFCERSLPSSLSFLLTLSPPALSISSRPSIFLSPLSHFLLLLLSHFCSSSVFSSSIFFFFYFFLPLLTSSLLYPTFFLPFRFLFLSFSHFFVIFD